MQKILRDKNVVAPSVAEFSLVKKLYNNNVISFIIYVLIIKHAKFSYSSIESQLHVFF